MCDPRLGHQGFDSSPLDGGSITTTKTLPDCFIGQLHRKFGKQKEKGGKLQFIGNILSLVDHYTKDYSSQSNNFISGEREATQNLSVAPTRYHINNLSTDISRQAVMSSYWATSYIMHEVLQ